MRQSPLVAVLFLAGCEVATRNANELAFLRDVEEHLDAGDRCGLYRLVTTRPGVLPPGDPLALELRSFARASRSECLFGRNDQEDGGSFPMPDVGLVELARSEISDARDAQDATSDDPPGTDAGGGGTNDVPSGPAASPDEGRDERTDGAPGRPDAAENRGGGSAREDDRGREGRGGGGDGGREGREGRGGGREGRDDPDDD